MRFGQAASRLGQCERGRHEKLKKRPFCVHERPPPPKKCTHTQRNGHTRERAQAQENLHHPPKPHQSPPPPHTHLTLSVGQLACSAFRSPLVPSMFMSKKRRASPAWRQSLWTSWFRFDWLPLPLPF